MPVQSLTKSEVVLDGSVSYDEDGGDLSCMFTVSMPEGNSISSTEEDCVFEHTWDDDGTYDVQLSVTDDENDEVVVVQSIEILNRPPKSPLVPSMSGPTSSPSTIQCRRA